MQGPRYVGEQKTEQTSEETREYPSMIKKSQIGFCCCQFNTSRLNLDEK
jgi:hypothetical protein